MTHNAQEFIKQLMPSVDPDEKHSEWDFLNHVLMGTAPSARLNGMHISLLTVTLCDRDSETMDDRTKRHRWAMQIATWINSVHAARCSNA